MSSISLTTAARGYYAYTKTWIPTSGDFLEVRSVRKEGGGGVNDGISACNFRPFVAGQFSRRFIFHAWNGTANLAFRAHIRVPLDAKIVKLKYREYTTLLGYVNLGC